MLKAGRGFADRIWAVEGCNGVGKHIAHRLVHDGETVVDVPAKLSAQARVFATGNGRKTDPVDAHSVAVAALRTPDLVVLGLLVDRRDELGRARTQTVNRLHRLLLELFPGGAKRFLSADQARAMPATIRPRDIVGRTRRRLAAELVTELKGIDKRTKATDKELSKAVFSRRYPWRRGYFRLCNHHSGLAANCRERGRMMVGVRGHQLLAMQQYEAACHAFDADIELGRGDAGTYVGRGVASIAQGRPEEALPYLDQALARDPVHWDARYYRSVASGRLGQYADALVDLNVVADGCDRAAVLVAGRSSPVPATGTALTTGVTATTSAGESRTASRSPGTAKIGPMLATGLLGPRISRSAAVTASRTPGAGRAAVAPAYATDRTAGEAPCRTRNSS